VSPSIVWKGEEQHRIQSQSPDALGKTLGKKIISTSFPFEPNYDRNYNMPHAAQDHSRDPWYEI
jgi:hypothetical protein